MSEESATRNERDEREASIRARAHELWEREGRPNGRHAEHWAQAELELACVDESGAVLAQSSSERTS